MKNIIKYKNVDHLSEIQHIKDYFSSNLFITQIYFIFCNFYYVPVHLYLSVIDYDKIIFKWYTFATFIKVIIKVLFRTVIRNFT